VSTAKFAAQLSGSFAGTGQSASIEVDQGQAFGASLFPAGFNATVGLERSHDGGTTWVPITRDWGGAAVVWTAIIFAAFSEPEPKILYRFNCTAWVSGTINYRLAY
jgi:hypothetical protein